MKTLPWWMVGGLLGGFYVQTGLGAPTNDLFSNSTVLSGASVTRSGSTVGASKEAGEPDHAGDAGGKSVWFQWTAPASGRLSLSTSLSSFDTLLAVYIGSAVESLTPIAANDNDGTNLTSTLLFNVASNVTYQIALDGKSGSSGNYVLRLSFTSGQYVPSDSARVDFWATDGPVYSIIATNGVAYAGGSFNYVFPHNRGMGGLFDLRAGTADPGFPQADGGIIAACGDGQGGWYVGGQFTSIGGATRANLAHIRSDRSVDPAWRADTDGAVLTLALNSGLLLVGGQFTTIGGVNRSALAAVNGDGTVTPWNPDVFFTMNFAQPFISTIVASSNTVWVGGYFTSVGGIPHQNIAAIDFSTGQPTPWTAGGETNVVITESTIYALVLWGNTLFVGGTFNLFYWQDRSYLAALDTTTGAVLPWNPYADGPVYALAMHCDTVIAGGDFRTVGGKQRHSLAALNAVTGQCTTWDPAPDHRVGGLRVSGNTVYVGGDFTFIGGRHQPHLAALDFRTGKCLAWSPQADRFVQALVLSANTLYAGGLYPEGGMIRNNLAAFDARTGEPTEWNPNANGSIQTMALDGDTLYAGGDFTEVGGQVHVRVSALNAATGEAKAWSPTVDSTVYAILATTSNVYIGGIFSNVCGLARPNIAALDLNSAQATSWNPRANGGVSCLVMNGNVIYAGGMFTNIGGQVRYGVAALDARTGQATSWVADMRLSYGPVYNMAFGDNTLYVGSEYSLFGPYNGLFELYSSSGAYTPWYPTPWSDFGNYFYGRFEGMTVWGEAMFVGGIFSGFADLSRPNMAALNRSSAGDPWPWLPLPNSTVLELAHDETTLYAGGYFSTINGAYTPFLAAFQPTGAPVVSTPPASQVATPGQMVTLTCSASGQVPLRYQWRRDGTNLPAGTNATLTISGVTAADSGRYDVLVNNGLGYALSQKAELVVFEPLVITLQPAGQTVAPGATVIFNVSVSGEPPPQYQWRLNGVNIPGAIGSTLVISNAQPTNGGSYSVIAANVGGAIVSDSADLIVNSTELPFADNLADRIPLIGSSGVVSGSNAGATVEPGETNHVGKIGGASVWLSWTAPYSGIATFSTLGSTFDTLLAIYTGSSVNNLAAVAADEDRGGFLTSQASFNAVGGTEYLIAIDGFGGATGHIVLSWSLDGTTVEFPRIINQPLSQTKIVGQDAFFAVDVASPSPVSFQWFVGCEAIAGATNAMLVISNVQPWEVGNYHVLVVNASRYTAESWDAALEIGPDPKVISYDKFQDLLAGDTEGAMAMSAGKFFAASSAGSSSFILVAAGTPGAQLLNNVGAMTEPGEPIACGVIGGASKWFGLKAGTDGVIRLDTIGSAIDTVLAVYTGTNLLTLHPVGCDDNSAPDRMRSLLYFPAAAGTKYSVAVDGVNGVQGAITLNWLLGLKPMVVSSPRYPTVREGANVLLTATVTNPIPAPEYQWRFNDANLAGETNTVLSLNGIGAAQAGIYSVAIKNFAGAVTSTVATVTVALPVRLQAQLLRTHEKWQLEITAPTSTGYILQGTTNLVDWINVETNIGSAKPLEFFELLNPSNPWRFYRLHEWE